jgi:hypothetical protein
MLSGQQTAILRKIGAIVVNAQLWVLQILLAAICLFSAAVHFVLPPDLPAPLEWMYALPTPLHSIAGAAEVLAAFGLILPGLIGFHTRVTSLAALGLAVVMIGAIVFHTQRGESLNAVVNAVVTALATIVAYGRWRVGPLTDRTVQEIGTKVRA